MNADQILAEIREANLSYLMLAQSLIRADREQALYRLGVSEDTATLIGTLTPAQMMKIAAGNTLLCRFRMDDDIVWGLLTSHGKGAANDSVNRLHASHPDGRPPPRSRLTEPMARNKSILTEARQIERAVTLIHLGARLQVLESETDLSYERLLRLYKEVAGKSPSKGQLPFSTDWFMTWQPNIHASLFLNIHEYLNKVVGAGRDRHRHQGLPALPGADAVAGPGAAAVRDARLAPGEVRRQRHADDDQVQQVRRPLRDPPARDRQALRLRPVQPAGARRQGQAGRCAADPVGPRLCRNGAAHAH